MTPEIKAAYDNLSNAILSSVLARLGAPLEGTVVGLPKPVKRGPGRPPGKAKRKLPIQYCPVPGCGEKAAPALNMLCSKHRDTPKRLVKKYRDARRAAKSAAKASRS